MKIQSTIPQIAAAVAAKNEESPLKLRRNQLIGAGLVAVLLVILAIAVASGAISFQKVGTAAVKHAPVLTVTVQKASFKPIERQLAVHGSIWAWDPVSVGATASGLETKSILFEEGDFVKKGQILATLDASELQAQLDSEKARLESSLANAQKSIQPNRPEDINALAAAVEQDEASVDDQQAALLQAQANLENANVNVKRYELLRAAEAVSAQEAENRALAVHVDEAIVHGAQKRLAASKFVLKQAQDHLAMARAGGRKEDIQMAHASVAEIRGNVRKLQTQIDETVIRAPVNGLIVRRDAHIGDISSVGKTMFLLARDNRLELKAQVPETDLHLIQRGQVVDLDSSFIGTKTAVGSVREISPLVDQDTRQATVRIDVPNNCGLKSGMYAEANIKIGQQLALTVPSQSVINRDEKNTVFVLHNDQVESRPVTVSGRDHNLVNITAGLTPSDEIVVDGAGFLKDGDFVAVSR